MEMDMEMEMARWRDEGYEDGHGDRDGEMRRWTRTWRGGEMEMETDRLSL